MGALSENVSQVSQVSHSLVVSDEASPWPVGTPEQAEAFKEEVARIGRSKIADMAEAANLSGNDIMGYNNDNNDDTNRCQDRL
jgi:hypothetical protein